VNGWSAFFDGVRALDRGWWLPLGLLTVSGLLGGALLVAARAGDARRAAGAPTDVPTLPCPWPLDDGAEAALRAELAATAASRGKRLGSDVDLGGFARQAAVARGAAIADNGGCRGCHGEDLTGRRLAEGVYEGRIVAPSLTPEGPTATWSATDALRLLRHGERPDGSLVLHPLRLGAPWSDVDISDLWAFLRTLPPSSDGLPPTEVGLPLRAALGVGLVTLGGSAPADGTEDRPFGLSGRARPEGCEACHGPHTAPVAFGDATWGAAVAGAALLTAGQAALDDAIQRNIGFDGRPLAASAHAGLAR
jgi:cytochrome c553